MKITLTLLCTQAVASAAAAASNFRQPSEDQVLWLLPKTTMLRRKS
jgi:hypothetical protein